MLSSHQFTVNFGSKSAKTRVDLITSVDSAANSPPPRPSPRPTSPDCLHSEQRPALLRRPSVRKTHGSGRLRCV